MKQTKRIITLLLALTMVLSMSSAVFAAAPSFTGRMDDADTESAETPAHNYANGFCTDCGAYEPAPQVTAENQAELGLSENYIGYYAIGNAGQLYWYADQVFNAHSLFYTSKMVLTSNITVNTGTMTAASANVRSWNPIGDYEGTIDGKGHSISGLYCKDGDSYHNAGFVSVLMRGGVVKNLTISNSYFCGENGVGSIVGHNLGTISGCVNNATAESSDGMQVGGIAGHNEGTVTGCINNSTISGYSDVGGIAGYNTGSVTQCSNAGTVRSTWNNVGGIVGSNEGTITGCANNSNIESVGYAGGITGVNLSTVELCGNTGKVTVTDQLAGGIASWNQGTVRNCWNTGAVKAGSYAVGGIVGLVSHPSGLAAPVENCWSTGTVTCDDNNATGGVVGNATGATPIQNCYSTEKPIGGKTEKTNVTHVEQKTPDQFASGEVAYLLGGVWGQNIDNGKTVQTVPVFSNATVYQIGTGIYSNDPNAHVHDYSNGFCTDCDAYEPAPLVTSDNYSQLGLSASDVGFYAISNAGQLYWFAQRSVEYPKDNAVLAKNITVNSGTVNASSVGLREWTPIAGCNNDFHGIFDGNGKTISGLYYKHIGDGDGGYYVGLVSILGKTGVVKNVTISNSYLEAFWHIGAIAGHNDGLISNCGNNSTTIKSERNAGGITGVNMGTIELCGNSGNITVKDQCAGGIIGCHMEGTVRNCWNTGNVKAGKVDAGGIAGLAACNPGTSSIVENCWSTGTVTCDGSKSAGGIVGIGSSSQVVRNCYTTSDIAIGKDESVYPNFTPIVENVETKTRDQFTSGEVAYLLQKDLTTPIWGQNLDNGKPVQTVPLFSTATVYQIELDNKGTVGYSNDPNAGGSGNTDSPALNKDWQTGGRLPVAAYILVDDEPVFLAGAGFTLYADEACTQPITVSGNGTHEGNPLYQIDPNGTVTEIFTDDSGQFTIGGLESGTYYLKQTTTPPGYSSDDDSIGAIPVTFSAKGELSYPSIDEDSPLVDENGKISFVPNRNHADTTQPTPDDAGNPDGTGSAGIYILIGILGLLAVAAAVLLIIKFRTRAAR